MTMHAKRSAQLQLVEMPGKTNVEIPLPLLRVFANFERSFFDLCIEAGQQISFAMME